MVDRHVRAVTARKVLYAACPEASHRQQSGCWGFRVENITMIHLIAPSVFLRLQYFETTLPCFDL
jgi:hypothetical protein